MLVLRCVLAPHTVCACAALQLTRTSQQTRTNVREMTESSEVCQCCEITAAAGHGSLSQVDRKGEEWCGADAAQRKRDKCGQRMKRDGQTICGDLRGEEG